MPIKKYRAETWEEALNQVKAELGDEAIILHSKTYKDKGFMGVGQRSVIEITASDDPSLAPQSSLKKTRGDQTSSQDLHTPSDPSYARLLEKAYEVAARKSKDRKEPSPSSLSSESKLFTKTPLATLQKDPAHNQIESLLNEITEIKAQMTELVQAQKSDLLTSATEALRWLHDNLLKNAVSEELARDITLEVNRNLSGNQLNNQVEVQSAAIEVISKMIPFSGPLGLSSQKSSIIALIGPTGVGKTTTLSKLAADLLIKEKSCQVAFITIDTYRLGATEQLKTLANVLDVPMRVVMSPSEMRTTLKELQHCNVVFIDTAGRSQRDTMKMNELKTFLDAAAPDETHLCINATTHPVHLMSVLDQFSSLSIDKVILTKLDEAAIFGPVLDVIMRAGKPLSYLTVGQNIPDDIELASSRRLARLLLGLDSIDKN